MSEESIELSDELERLLSTGFRGRLLDRGLARGLIWEEGELPAGSPHFAINLSDDLLDYGHGLLALALNLRSIEPDHKILSKAFRIAGESIESAVHRGEVNKVQGFHRVAAGVAFHLARYSARAFSILQTPGIELNLSPEEAVIVSLLKRNFESMQSLYSSHLLNGEHSDERIAERLRSAVDYEESDAVSDVLQNGFMSGIALFGHALSTGSFRSAISAKEKLLYVAESAVELNFVNQWWTATLAAHLVDELWGLSFYIQLPLLPNDDPDSELWEKQRLNFIQRLYAAEKPSIEFWPSQLEASKRVLNKEDDLVVALPTSAGKTRIAELCILRTLSSNRRVIYVTPLRALSAQIERDLAETFRPLGFSVSALYGSAGVESEDTGKLKSENIVVATPEKLDFALRNDESIINDVGLIVFDEGHMLGKGEREVRYETLVQGILRREDAASRRIVCLSAIFPSPEDMEDLVGWIRQDDEGSPIHSTWRPTRQRFGVIKKTSSGGGRLEVTLGKEKPFLPNFIDSKRPPKGQRKNNFPQNKNEFTIAAAWKFLNQGKKVLIYSPLRSSVEVLGKLVSKLISQRVIAPYKVESEALKQAKLVGIEWLGADHPAVKCLKFGVALHHGGLPRPFLAEIEKLLKMGECELTIASPTLAQGLNLSASVLLVPSITRVKETIPATEFANVAGRAGRAYADLEGLILHIIWDDDPDWYVKKWEKLVDDSKGAALTSGILDLAISLFLRIRFTSGASLNEVVDYITGNSSAWDFIETDDEDDNMSEEQWEREIASLDSVLLGSVAPETSQVDIDEALMTSLEASLFSRQVHEDDVDTLLQFLASRANHIWSQTNETQRRGFYSAGIGLKAGSRIYENLDFLLDLLIVIESGIASKDEIKVVNGVLAFADLVFQFAPFEPYKGTPDKWEPVISQWMMGAPASDVIKNCEKEAVDFLQDAVAYRLSTAEGVADITSLFVGGGSSMRRLIPDKEDVNKFGKLTEGSLSDINKSKGGFDYSNGPALGQFRDANGRLRNSDGTFAYDGGSKILLSESAHGNTAGFQPATLYERYDADGNFLKYGISQNPSTRYTQKELAGGFLIETKTGPRKEILKTERDLVETNPGPLNKEPWAGKRSEQ